MRGLALALALPVFAFGCAPAGTSAPAALSAEDEQSIRAVVDEWARAFEESDPEGMVATYTEDYVETRPTPVEGREAALALYQSMSLRFSSVEFDVRRIEGSGDLAYAWMPFENRFTTEDGRERIQTGTQISVFRRDAEGTWRFQATGWQSSTRAADGA